MSAQKRSKIVYSTPTSLSLEKLMMEELDFSSSDFNTSGGISSRSSMSAPDSADDTRSLDPSSWSFEGERKSHRKIKKPRKAKRPESPPPDEHNVGRCVVGCAADCTALCCCCPLTVFHILALVCYKLPVSVCRKLSRPLRKKKREKLTAKLKASGSFSSEERWSAAPSVAASQPGPTSPVSLPASIQHRFGFGGHHLWREFESGHSSVDSP